MSVKKLFGFQKLLIIAFIGVSNIQYLGAQKTEADTIDIIRKIVEERDTLVRSGTPDPADRWDQPIDSVLFRNHNTRFKKELYNLIIKSETEAVKTPANNASFAAMDGRTIRRIEFNHVDIFAPSVIDTNYKPYSWFEKTVNVAHKNTRKSLLNRYMLISRG
jgi:hypothetical protein